MVYKKGTLWEFSSEHVTVVELVPVIFTCNVKIWKYSFTVHECPLFCRSTVCSVRNNHICNCESR